MNTHSLLRSRCERLTLRAGRNADQGWRDASADIRPALSPDRRLDCSGYDLGANAKVPRVSRSLCCDWDWSRAFALNRNALAGVASVTVRGLAAVPGSETPVPRAPRERGSLKSEESNSHDSNKGDCTLKTTNIILPKVVSRDEWLAKEKAATRARDASISW